MLTNCEDKIIVINAFKVKDNVLVRHVSTSSSVDLSIFLG